MSLLVEIEKHLRECAIPPTAFGREAARDPRLVFDLRKGREPGVAMAARVRNYMRRAGARS